MIRTAILVDGGFYTKRAYYLFGDKSPEDRATEMITYCMRHIEDKSEGKKQLYRIFYYDCPPSQGKLVHPLTHKNIDLSKSAQYKWTTDFFNELSTKRKVALRKGELLESSSGYVIKPDIMKKLLNQSIAVSDLKENDFVLDIKQKGVDMKIGLDIASLAQKKLVDQIILIAGDSDFVPAAKHARREGIDFILDPMWHTIKPSLNEHIDGLRSRTPRPGSNKKEALSITGSAKQFK